MNPQKLEMLEPAFISFINSDSAKMSGFSIDQIYNAARNFGFSEQEAYGAQVAYPFFKSDYAHQIKNRLTTHSVIADINTLLITYTKTTKQKYAYLSLEEKKRVFKETIMRDFNENVLHNYTCTKLGYNPKTTSISDLAQAVKDGKVNQEAYQHAMICTQFVRYYLTTAAQQ